MAGRIIGGKGKITAHTMTVMARSGAKKGLELTDQDRADMAKREEERVARLARIAARAAGKDA